MAHDRSAVRGVEPSGSSDRLQVHGANKAFTSREELSSFLRFIAMAHLMVKASSSHA
jgi:hypothetical protein